MDSGVLLYKLGRTDIVRLNYIYMASLYVGIQIIRLNERYTTQVTGKKRVLSRLLNGVRGACEHAPCVELSEIVKK